MAGECDANVAVSSRSEIGDASWIATPMVCFLFMKAEMSFILLKSMKRLRCGKCD